MQRSLRPRILGLFPGEGEGGYFWIREEGRLEWPPLKGRREIIIEGEVRAAAADDPTSAGELGLAVSSNWGARERLTRLKPGPFSVRLKAPSGAGPHRLALRVLGVDWSNLRAWLGRVTGLRRWQPWRHQARNRRLQLRRIRVDHEILFDFGRRAAPWNGPLLRRHLRVGLNVLGYLRADLGIGESARCMVRAADAAMLPVALVDLKLPCRNPLGDSTFQDRLQDRFPHPATVVHVDPPGMRDLAHHHGRAPGRSGRLIGYWAWELPEFPDGWIDCADHCEEIWTPSRFSAEAIAEKVAVPVITMPHAIGFTPPAGDFRAKYSLPRDRFLFLFLFDLNSYAARKNPSAVIEAFRRSGLANGAAALVIKVHNVDGNEADAALLREAVAALPGTTLIERRLDRHEIYELQSACDCFVSLHRSEGFGLAIAEAMYLGKPVISTDWSATAEFVTEANGLPVRCRTITLERDHGPYTKGQVWAEPDVDHAASQMRRVAGDPDLVRALGSCAAATMRARFSPAAVGARYRRRLEAIASW